MKANVSLLFSICIVTIPVIKCIINGVPAQRGQFPYMAVLIIKDYNMVNCGATIISSRLLATTAHCICDKWSYTYYYAVVGVTNIRSPAGQQYELEQSICHENYVANGYANDIGLTKTTKPIVFGYDVQFIALQTEEIGGGNYIVATGWGCLKKGDKEHFPDDLRYDFLEVMYPEQCQKIFWEALNFNFICSRTELFKGMCAGDSGGPVAYNGRLAGISYGGVDKFPDLYVKISEYVSWIHGKIQIYNRDPTGYLYADIEPTHNYTYNYMQDFNKAWYKDEGIEDKKDAMIHLWKENNAINELNNTTETHDESIRKFTT